MRTVTRLSMFRALVVIALILGVSGITFADDVLVTTNQTKLSGTLLETALVVELEAGGIQQFPLPLIYSLASSEGRTKLKLTNGDVVSGQLRDYALHFRTASSDLTVPVDKTASISLGARAASPEVGEAQLVTLRNGDSFGWSLAADDTSVINVETSFSDPLRLQLSQIAELTALPDGGTKVVMRNGDIVNGKVAATVFKIRTIFGVMAVKSQDIQTLRHLTKQENETRRVVQPPAPAQPPAKVSGAPVAPAAAAAKSPVPSASTATLELTQPLLAIRGQISDEERAFPNYAWSKTSKLAASVGVSVGNGKTRYDLYIYDAKTKQSVTVTSDGNSTFPTWSADGRTLAWAYRATGAKTSEIWLVDADGKNKRPLTKRNGGDFSDLAWSPDGTRIAFAYADSVTGVEGLCAINADGTGYRVMETSATENFYHLRWSPNGTKLLYTAAVLGTKPYSSIQLEDVATGNTRTLVPSDKKWVNDAAEWSPDGKQVAFSSNRAGSRRIFRVSADGGDPVQLTNAESDDLPAWRPAGGVVTYISTRNGNRQVAALDLGTLHTWPLTTEGKIVGGPQFSPDGAYLAFVRLDRVPELWVASIPN